MSYHLTLPNDLYYWGQDRLGSFLPLVSSGLIATGISPLTSVAVINQLILTTGCFFFIKLFSDNLSKLIFIILWFFPPSYFIELLYPAHPDNIFLGAIAYVAYCLKTIKQDRTMRKDILRFLLMCVVCSIALWATEAAIVIFPLLLIPVIHSYNQNRKLFLYQSFIAILVVSFLIFFLIYAKSHALATSGYMSLNTKEEMVNSLNRIFQAFLNEVSGKYGIFKSLTSILGLTSLILFFLFLKQSSSRFYLISLYLVFTLFSISIFSNWVYLNGTGARYFIVSFYLLAVTIMLLSENISSKRKMILGPVICFVLISGADAIISEHTRGPHSTYKKLKEFNDLGEIAIIGDYWHSYNIASIDPSKIIATPHDKQQSRSVMMRDRVLSKTEVYFVRDYWFESYPDTIFQYGNMFVRNSQEEIIGGYSVAKYLNKGKAN